MNQLQNETILIYFAADSYIKPKQFRVYICYSDQRFMSFCGVNYHRAIGSKFITDGWKEGDRFKMIVDFERHEIGFMYNDVDQGVVFKNNPDKLVPAVCVCSPMELMCAKYELIKKHLNYC